MNPETPQPSREEIEAKLTALLLGELPVEEAQLLRWAISQDAALAQLHDRLKATIGFVSEVAASPAETIPAQTAPLKLSEARREKLLAHFKTVAPKEFVPLMPPLKKRRDISPLIAMAAAVALIAVLAAMLLPALASAKRKAQNISAASQARMKEMDARLAAGQNTVDQNVPTASVPLTTPPPTASEQRVESLEAYVQNGNPTDSSVNGWKNQTTIVLPLGGTAGAELAAETPAPSANFNFGLAAGNPSRDQDVFTVRMNNADPNQSAQVLQKMFQGSGDASSPAAQTPAQANLARSEIAPGNNAPAVAVANRRNVAGGAGVGRGGRGGGANGGGGGGGFAGDALLGPSSTAENASQTPAPAGTTFAPIVAPPAADAAGFQYPDGNKSAGGLEIKTFSGAVAVNDTGAQTVDRTRSFFRNLAPDSGAFREPNVPLLGDVPVLGNVFQGSSENNSKGSSFDNTGSIVLADNLSTFGNGAMTLNGFNTYNGVITKNGDGFALGAPENLGEELTHTADTLNRPAQVENEFVLPMQSNLPVANNESTQLAYNNSAAQLNLSRFKQDGAVGTSAIEVDSDTHNLIAVSDAVTMDKIRDITKKLDQTPSVARAAPPVVIANGESTFSGRRLFAPRPIQATNAIALDGRGSVAGTVNLNYAAGLPASAPVATDAPLPKTPSPAPIPTLEILTRENAFSTFSLNVSDVSFKLAAASLERGQLPDAASIRTEEFINAFNYHDPEPAAGVPVAFVAERARYPFAQNRDLLRFSVKTAAAGREAGRPLNLVLLLDNSGSMERADRVAIIHEALKVLASQLQPQDTLSIVTFARTARLWVDGARGDQAGDAVSKVSDLTPEGWTNLEEAMNLAYATARRHYLANGANRVVLLTDGAANLGNVNPQALKQNVESFRKQGIALDCFGIGWEGYNDDLLEQLSSNGDGRYGFINTPEAATTEFAAELAGALHAAAEDVKVQVEFNPQRVISYRQIGYAKHQFTKEQFRDNTVAAAPMAAREAGNALYTVEVNPQGVGPLATVRVRFRIPGTTDVSEHEWQVPFDGTAPALEKSSPALRLAATASAFSEWLASSPFAQEVTTDQLLNYLNGVPAIYGADARPKQLETMIREAKSLSGK
jgi:Mg-chelatase subunit ChlD/type II secretory pathway pseudopilin PulG